MDDQTQQLLYSKKSASKVLDVSVRAIEYLLASNQLESRRVGRKVLIPRTSLMRFAGRDHTTIRPREGASETGCSQTDTNFEPAEPLDKTKTTTLR